MGKHHVDDILSSSSTANDLNLNISSSTRGIEPGSSDISPAKSAGLSDISFQFFKPLERLSPKKHKKKKKKRSKSDHISDSDEATSPKKNRLDNSSEQLDGSYIGSNHEQQSVENDSFVNVDILGIEGNRNPDNLSADVQKLEVDTKPPFESSSNEPLMTDQYSSSSVIKIPASSLKHSVEVPPEMIEETFSRNAEEEGDVLWAEEVYDKTKRLFLIKVPQNVDLVSLLNEAEVPLIGGEAVTVKCSNKTEARPAKSEQLYKITTSQGPNDQYQGWNWMLPSKELKQFVVAPAFCGEIAIQQAVTEPEVLLPEIPPQKLFTLPDDLKQRWPIVTLVEDDGRNKKSTDCESSLSLLSTDAALDDSCVAAKHLTDEEKKMKKKKKRFEHENENYDGTVVLQSTYSQSKHKHKKKKHLSKDVNEPSDRISALCNTHSESTHRKRKHSFELVDGNIDQTSASLAVNNESKHKKKKKKKDNVERISIDHNAAIENEFKKKKHSSEHVDIDFDRVGAIHNVDSFSKHKKKKKKKSNKEEADL